jgi:DME family drug/metabolite transporter
MTAVSTPAADRRSQARELTVRTDLSGGKTRHGMHHRMLGTVSVTTAALCWGTIGIATSFLPPGTNPLSIAAARMAVGGGVLLAIAARPSTVRPLLSGRRPVWVVLAMVAMAVDQLAYFTAIADAGMAIATVVSIGTIPLFAGLFSRLARARLSRRWLASTVGAVAGCVLLALHGAERGQHMMVGIGSSIAVGAVYALFTVISARLIATGASPQTTMALAFGGAAVFMSPILAGGSSRWLLTPAGAGVTLYLGLAATAGAYLLYGHALRTVPVPVVSTLVLVEPACATLLAITFLHEHLDRLTGAGLALLCLTLLAAEQPDSKPNPLPHPAPGRRDPSGPRTRRRSAKHKVTSRTHRTRRAPLAGPARTRTPRPEPRRQARHPDGPDPSVRA